MTATQVPAAPRIVILEDERILALQMKQQLAKLGYDVVAVASSGEMALEKIAKLRPDVALMDIRVEGSIDGIEAAARIPPELQTLVIYMTASSDEATLARASETKPYGYIIKPFSQRELHAAIQMALRRRQADTELQASEERFRSIFSAISDGIFMTDAATMTFLDVNEAGCVMFGYAPGELIGSNIQVLSSGVPPYTQHDAAEWNTESAISGVPQRFDWHCRKKDGRLFWAEISLRFATIGGRDVALAILRDLTERHAIEAHLDQAQEIAGFGSWEMDVVTGKHVWSKQLYRIRGQPFDFELTRESLATSVHAEDAQLRADWFGDLQSGREREPIEIKIVRPGGETRVLRMEGRAVADASSVIRSVVGTAQDVTERRLIERQLAQAQKMEAIGNLTGGMAHDFNNMLGVIIGNLELLRRVAKDDDIASELCGEALDGANKCTDLIRRLLAFARRQSLHPEQIDVNALVSDIARLLGRTLGEHITIKLDLESALWPVMADPIQLQNALINLATNARDAMPKCGNLDIVTRKTHLDESYAALHPDASPGDYALIEISDTGSGIPPHIIGRIFEPFFTTKEPGQGTGLGLSMAFGFIKQSGGHLSVYSEPGLGTTFRLYLPRHNAVGLPRASVSDAVGVVGGEATVLLVEDNAQLRQATVRQLAMLGYQVRTAENADAALAILSGADHVDLLFTDIVMPGTTNGMEMALQAVLLRPRLRVLLTSGFPSIRGVDERIKDSPFPLLNKPYRYEELARILREVLDKVDSELSADDREDHGPEKPELA